jgi:phosphoglucomutase
MLEQETVDRVSAFADGADAETLKETVDLLVDALKTGDTTAIQEAFYQDLDFGTGGLRGLMGPGTNRMNRVTVAKATQGLVEYIRRNVPEGTGSVCIAYDSRIMSAEFARVAARVVAGNGMKAYLFEDVRPTPELSFAVRHFKATAGIVITASHNPKEYNGYKVYWNDGAQVVPPHDKGIIDEVRGISSMRQVNMADFEQEVRKDAIHLIGETVDRLFIESLDAVHLQPDLTQSRGDELKIVFTPLHGTGGTIIPDALRKWGFFDVVNVPEQEKPDGTFPTIKSPNPEEKAAMELALRLAEAENADLAFATDPDADRIGIAVRHEGDFQLLTGNQVGALLSSYICGILKQQGRLPANGVLVKTIVTTNLIEAIAAEYGVGVENCLTGFKYIAELIRRYEEEGAPDKPSKEYLFGCEESYGYLAGTHVRDKDSVVTACLIAEMALWAKAAGKTLVDLLHELFARHGVYVESQLSRAMPGMAGMQQIGKLMQSLRANPPLEVGGIKVATVTDVDSDSSLDVASQKRGRGLGLPRSNVLVFGLEDGSTVVARPSGTEPKIKFYFMVVDRAGFPLEDVKTLPARIAACREKEQVLYKELGRIVGERTA